MLDGRDECARRGSAQRFAHPAHERRRNRRTAASRHPLCSGAFTECVFEDGHEHFTMFHALRVRREPFVT